MASEEHPRAFVTAVQVRPAEFVIDRLPDRASVRQLLALSSVTAGTANRVLGQHTAYDAIQQARCDRARGLRRILYAGGRAVLTF